MKVLIAGGGTAGHINPGISIAKHIKNKSPDAKIVFAGTKRGLETSLVPREGFELRLITVRGFKRKLSADTFIAVKELFQGIIEARGIIKELKPDVVIGTGGYVCGPVLFIASRMKIPTLIHEQNAFPGVTNRILSRFVNAVAISFKESRGYFKSAKELCFTGNPVRQEMALASRTEARKNLGLPLEQRIVVVMGGSRGAEKINDTVADMVLKNLKRSDLRLIFATGEGQFERINDRLKDADPQYVQVLPYIYDTANVMASADIVICRAGAITTSELTVMGVPSILIPSPYVTANHQEYNARALEKNGAAVVILEKDLSCDILYNQMTELLKDREQLCKMSRNAKKMGISNACEKIYEIITQIIGPRGVK